jgi:2-phosphosulfolactate phosphatase
MSTLPTNTDWLQSFEPWPAADIHVEWGLAGSKLAAARGDLVVLVDVLSFSTSLSIACGRGATVLVYSPNELDAMGGREKAARDLKAEVITKSRQAEAGSYSLSPASVTDCPADLRLIVTSPNGAACVAAAAKASACVIGCLRNRTATAAYIKEQLRDDANQRRRATIVPCGEQWSSVGEEIGWRPCVEDWLGAGSIVDALQEEHVSLSVEAELAMRTFQSMSGQVGEFLRNCLSGRELVARSFATDVELAAEIDAEAGPVVAVESHEREFRGR